MEPLDPQLAIALDRLTEREKECLRGILNHQTAKQMALELGITHHAVEKRLKQARTKLGAATSLEAARMLGKADGYDRPVSGSPEVPPAATIQQSQWTKQPLVMGVLTMNLVAFTLVSLAVTQPPMPGAEYQTDAAPAVLAVGDSGQAEAEQIRRRADRERQEAYAMEAQASAETQEARQLEMAMVREEMRSRAEELRAREVELARVREDLEIRQARALHEHELELARAREELERASARED